jgi:hypothetical protein
MLPLEVAKQEVLLTTVLVGAVTGVASVVVVTGDSQPVAIALTRTL